MQTVGKKIIEPSTDEVMDYRGLSVYLKIAQGTLRHKVMKNEIPFFKIGSSVRFSKRDIDVWLAGHRKVSNRKIVNVENSGGLFTAVEQTTAGGGEL